MSVLTPEPLNRVKSNENFRDIRINKDGVRLWKLTYDLHKYSNTNVHISYQQVEVTTRYNQLFQKNHQTLSEYYQIFKEAVDAHKHVGLLKPTKISQGVKFLQSLNRESYHKLHADIETQKRFNFKPHDTLEDAYRFALQYSVTNNDLKQSATTSRSIYHAESKQSNKKKFIKKISSKESSPTTSTTTTTSTNEKLFCKYCKKTNHNISDCRVLKKKNEEKETKQDDRNDAKPIVQTHAYLEVEVNNDDYVTEGLPVFDICNIKFHHNSNVVLYDTGAQGCVFKNKDFSIIPSFNLEYNS